jgi:hypothetical protein
MGRNVSFLPRDSTTSHSAISQGGWSRNLSPRISPFSGTVTTKFASCGQGWPGAGFFKDDTSI